MNPLKKGPEIKLPTSLSEVKVPGFARDVYQDLRNRHLLPLVALLLVAIAAVPFLLGESGNPEEEAEELAGISATASPSGNHFVVTRANPGLRVYKKRLAHHSPTDPFHQRFTSPVHEEGEEAEGASGEGGTEPAVGEGGGEETSGGESTGTTTQTTETHTTRYFTWEVDVKVTPVSTNGAPSKAEPSVRHNLPELTALPGRKSPALTFMQPSADGQKALMLVNANVQSLFGEGVCVSGGETCQLLALKKGFPETVVYGGNERIFKIELLDVHLVQTRNLKKAPLGSNHGN
jgi:hypothetical protein